MRVRRVLWWMAVVAGILCVAPATWWALGSNRGAADPGMDYFWRPPDISRGTGHVIGLCGWVSVGCAATLVLVAVRRGTVRPTLVPSLVPFALMSAFVGFFHGAATAPVIGANIGAGMLVFAAFPLFIGLSAWAMIAIDRHRRAVGQPTMVRSKT